MQVLRKKPDFQRKPWPTISNAAKDFVKRLLVKDPRARLTAAQALCMYQYCCFLTTTKGLILLFEPLSNICLMMKIVTMMIVILIIIILGFCHLIKFRLCFLIPKNQALSLYNSKCIPF